MVLCMKRSCAPPLNLAIMVTLEFPFAGDISVSNQAFIEKVEALLPAK